MSSLVDWKVIKDELIERKIFYVGKRYETIYSFQNNFFSSANIYFNTLGSDGAFQFNDNCQPALSANKMCMLTIVFQPMEKGTKRLYLTVAISDSEFHEAAKQFNVQVEAPVIIEPRLREGLPLQTELGKAYPVAFEFSVPGDRPATEVSVIPKVDVSLDFKLKKTIEGVRIDKTQSLWVEGIFTPRQQGDDQHVGVTFSYREGPDISLNSNLTQVIEKVIAEVTGSVIHDFPLYIKVGFDQPLVFMFHNEQITPATGIQVYINKD